MKNGVQCLDTREKVRTMLNVRWWEQSEGMLGDLFALRLLKFV